MAFKEKELHLSERMVVPGKAVSGERGISLPHAKLLYQQTQVLLPVGSSEVLPKAYYHITKQAHRRLLVWMGGFGCQRERQRSPASQPFHTIFGKLGMPKQLNLNLQ